MLARQGELGRARLGFGTSGLGSRVGRRKALRLLEAAYDAGIRHFDTAPPYGAGEAEAIMGEFLRSNPAGVTVTTKFGLEPPARSFATRAKLVTGRWLLSMAPALKRNRPGGATVAPVSAAVSPISLRRSLDRSTAALGRPPEALLLHEQPWDRWTPALTEEIEDLRVAKQIGAWGWAPAAGELPSLVSERLPGQVVQVADQDWSALQASRPSGRLVVTHSVFDRQRQAVLQRLAAEPSFVVQCSAALELDAGARRRMGRLFLQAAMERNRDGTVLFSSTDEGTIRRNAALQQRPEFTTDQVSILSTLLQQNATRAT